MKSNHGKVGEALCLKYTQDKFEEIAGEKLMDDTFIHIDEVNKKYGSSNVSIQIDNDTKGKYECICVYGVEIH